MPCLAPASPAQVRRVQAGVSVRDDGPMSLSSSDPVVEAALGFSPTHDNYYSYIWYATAVS